MGEQRKAMDFALPIVLITFCLFGVALIAKAMGPAPSLEVLRRCLSVGCFYAGCLLGCTGVFVVMSYAYVEWGLLGIAAAVPSYVAILSYIAMKAVP
jgi:hypothetical protein